MSVTTQAEYRLPPHVRPKRYVLTLTPDLDSFTFTGDETVEVEVDEPTDRILLNAAELQVSAANVTLADGTVLAAHDIAHDEDAETVALRFDRPVPVGSASLSVQFTGILNDQLRGFYRSQYTDADGATRYLATTQFEPTDARRAFPCWDEPARKATFQVTLSRAPGPGRRLQHARGERGGCRRRPQGRALCRDPGHVHLHPRLRRG